MSSSGYGLDQSGIAIAVRGLAKSYTIGRRTLHTTAAEALIAHLRSALRGAQRQTFWALKNISFDVHHGDVMGVIGRNGAGKSTLLKILSRITPPTDGEARLYGRVGSLLEVGTGFHPELTGRENVFLNGAILGMSRRDIARQFDAIVEFAEVGQFLETPVKRYSSGMHVRLAFSVAAHLDPEILVVDEVLAVGDAEFQRRCLGKMRDVAKSGRTVLFVSHNMAAIRNLCTRAILLHQGRLMADDTVERCIQTYASESRYEYDSRWERGELDPSKPLTIRRVMAELDGEQPNHHLNVQVELESAGPHRPAWIALEILDAGGAAIMQPLPTIEGFMLQTTPKHLVRLRVDLPPTIPGQYSVTVTALSHNTDVLDEAKECVGFEIRQSPTAGRTYPHTPDHGYVVPHTSLEYDAQ